MRRKADLTERVVAQGRFNGEGVAHGRFPIDTVITGAGLSTSLDDFMPFSIVLSGFVKQ